MKRLLYLALMLFFLLSCGLLDESVDDDDEMTSSDTAFDTSEEDDVSIEPAALDSDSEAEMVSDRAILFRDFAFPLPLFAADSAWNQAVLDADVLPESDEQMLVIYRVMLGDISDLEGYEEAATTWPFMDVNAEEYSIPVYRAGEGVRDVVICADEGVLGWPNPKFGIEVEGGPVPAPVPTSVVRPAGPENEDADGHMVLYDPETFTAYDFFAVTIAGEGDCSSFQGGMVGDEITEAGEVDFFDMRGSGSSIDGLSSARAHGTPLLAGLILPEDIEQGEIAHALALAIPGPRNLSRDPYEPRSSDFFYPASTTETDYYSTNPNALAAGQRLRLKQSLVDEDGELIDEHELAPITQMFLAALRNYGAYVVDNAGGFSFYAEDVHTAVLHLSDDEVNALIGRPPGTSLPDNRTKWEVVMEQLGIDLELIPIAMSPGDEEPDPETAEIEVSNFEVVEPAAQP